MAWRQGGTPGQPMCGASARVVAADAQPPRPEHRLEEQSRAISGGGGAGSRRVARARASQLKERDPSSLLLAWTTARCNANAKSTSSDWMLQQSPRTIRRIFFTIAIRTSSCVSEARHMLDQRVRAAVAVPCQPTPLVLPAFRVPCRKTSEASHIPVPSRTVCQRQCGCHGGLEIASANI